MAEIPNRRSALLLLAHPNERSFNRALADEAAEGIRAGGLELRYHDLYAEGFDPVMSKEEMLRRASLEEAVQTYSAELRRAALIVIVHPDWWGQPPAVLKGWLDRVLRPGVAYDFQGPEFLEKERVPLLTGVRGLVFATSDQPEPPGGPPLARIWRENVFEFCGIAPYEITVFHEVRTASRRQRKRWLRGARETTARFATGGE
jgi:putative NADPH-quinone reductase